MHELGIAAHRVGCGDDGACVAAEAARDVAYLWQGKWVEPVAGSDFARVARKLRRACRAPLCGFHHLRQDRYGAHETDVIHRIRLTMRRDAEKALDNIPSAPSGREGCA
jgi:hypothetical protein